MELQLETLSLLIMEDRKTIQTHINIGIFQILQVETIEDLIWQNLCLSKEFFLKKIMIIEEMKKMLFEELSLYSKNKKNTGDMEFIKNGLIDPILEDYFDLYNQTSIKLWTVFHECPETKNGYVIIFDPQKKKFGLGDQENKNKFLFFGLNQGFISALNSM